MRQPSTSVTGPSLPWPTPVMRSLIDEVARHCRGAAFDHIHDGHVIVDELQRRADAVVVEAHLNAVFLGAARREVAGMRIVGASVGIHERFEHVIGAHLVDALECGLVTLLEELRRFVPALAGQQQRQRVVLDALAPEFIELGRCHGPRRLLAVEFERLVQGPVRFLVELRDGELHAFAVALLEAREDRERRVDVAAADHVVEAQFVLFEVRDVRGQQARVLAVDAFEVAGVHSGRKLVVQLRLAVMHAFEHGADATGHRPVTLARNHRTCGQLRVRGRLGGAGEHEKRRQHGRGEPAGRAGEQ